MTGFKLSSNFVDNLEALLRSLRAKTIKAKILEDQASTSKDKDQVKKDLIPE